MLKKASFNCKDNANEWNNKTNNIVFVLGFPNAPLCLQFQYGSCDTVYRSSLLIKKVYSEIRKKHKKIAKKVLRDTWASNT